MLVRAEEDHDRLADVAVTFRARRVDHRLVAFQVRGENLARARRLEKDEGSTRDGELLRALADELLLGVDREARRRVGVALDPADGLNSNG